MKTAYIFIHGNLSKIPPIKSHIKKKDLVICADGAAEFALQQKITPDVIIGDFDSISPKVKKYFENLKVEWITYPREKDNTDADLAIQYAIKQKVKKIIILGLLGDRVDHMVSNLFHVSELAKQVDCQIMEGSSEMYFLRKSIQLTGKKGDELSIIPLQNDCVGVITKGLYYPLDQETVPFGSTRGISNVFVRKQIEVKMKSGLALVIHRKAGAK